MDNLRTILDNLDDLAESYVWARSQNMNGSVDSILKEMGISKSKFYQRFPANKRDELDYIAQQIFRNTQFRALKMMDQAAEKASKALVQLLSSAESESVKLQAAQYILNQTVGTPTRRVDLTSGGQTVKLYATVSPDDWDDK